MQRLIIVYNPSSSRFADVKKNVLAPAQRLNGYIIGKYEVEKTNLEANITKLAKLIQDGDLVISAGGDATGIIASNGILKSGKDAILAVLPYGNFNDLSHTLGTSKMEDVIFGMGGRDSFSEGDSEPGKARSSAARPWRRAGRTRPERKGFGQAPYQRLYPLEIIVDGKFFRYATCYVTIGMMAESVKIYDQPKMRKKLKTSFGRKISTYTDLAGWYFKYRHKKQFLPDFKLNGKLQPRNTSDYAAINGHFLARVLKSTPYYQNPHTFLHETDRLTNFWRLFKLITKSIFFCIANTETTYDKVEFLEPATIELQAEGEYQVFKNIKQIEIKKSDKYIKVIHK